MHPVQCQSTSYAGMFRRGDALAVFGTQHSERNLRLRFTNGREGANNLIPFLGPAMVRSILLCRCVGGGKALPYRSSHNGAQHYATACNCSLLYSFSASTSRYRIPSNHSSCLFTAGVPTRRKQFAAN
jgi:hypothetical protein